MSWTNQPREGFTESTSPDIYIYDNGEVLSLADSDLDEQITWSGTDMVTFGRSDGGQYDIFLATRIKEQD